MPWKEICPMDERLQFVSACVAGEETMACLCRQFGISRKTGYKWLRRYESDGAAGLAERSRAPRSHPNAVSAAVEERLLAVRRAHPHWGPLKVLRVVGNTSPELPLPAASTVAAIFGRHGLVKARRRRVRAPRGPESLTVGREANRVWSADFKGDFLLGNGVRCYPLTVCDHHSRYLLCCQGLLHPRRAPVQALFERLFRTYGLPDVLRTDNGSPFASVGVGGLSRLSVWWMRLGIRPERIAPGCPQQNGRHERLHRTLKQESLSPPKTTLGVQQRAFNRFRHDYNTERPHQALDFQTPAQHYAPSERPFPEQLPPMTYPKPYTVRVICEGGNLRWNGHKIFIGHALAKEPVGLKPKDDGLWELYYGALRLGTLDERKKSPRFKKQ